MGPNPSAEPVHVLVVEDHELLAQSLRYALRAEGLEVTICDDLSPAGVLSLVAAVGPDLVLLDFDLGANGTSLPLIARCHGHSTPVVMLTGVKDRTVLARCVEAGARGIIDKSQPLADLVAAVGQVATTGALMTPHERQHWLAELREHRATEARRLERFDRLTDREGQVLEALLDGRSADRIAETSFVSIATVRSQIKSILAKLGVNSQLAAVALAQRSGWPRDIDPS